MAKPATREIRKELRNAYKNGDFETLTRLQASDYDIFSPITSDGGNCLHLAIHYRQERLALWLIEQWPELILETDEKGQLPLHGAAAYGYTDLVVKILNTSTTLEPYVPRTLDVSGEHAPHPNNLVISFKYDKSLCSPIGYAVSGGHLGVVEAIIQHENRYLRVTQNTDGITRDARSLNAHSGIDRNSSTILLLAVQGARQAQKGIDSTRFNTYCLMIDALIKGGASQNRLSARNYTSIFPVHAASSPKVFRLLAANDPTLLCKKDGNGNYPMHHYARRGDLQLIKYILDGLDTQIHNALADAKTALIQLKDKLLTDKSENNQNALDIARAHHHNPVADFYCFMAQPLARKSAH